MNVCVVLNPLSANPTKGSNTLKQFVGKLPPNCLSVFYHFVKLALKGLMSTLIDTRESVALGQTYFKDLRTMFVSIFSHFSTLSIKV